MLVGDGEKIVNILSLNDHREERAFNSKLGQQSYPQLYKSLHHDQ